MAQPSPLSTLAGAPKIAKKTNVHVVRPTDQNSSEYKRLRRDEVLKGYGAFETERNSLVGVGDGPAGPALRRRVTRHHR